MSKGRRMWAPKLAPRGPVERVIYFCLTNQLITFMLLGGLVFWGLMVAPFDWHVLGLERSPVAVDAIPDIGENQQIVFTDWPGRSPQDVEDQISYPLTISLLGIPGVKTIRSTSMFGFSSIFIIFDEDIEFYWSRSRILEKLNSLPDGTLPEGVSPALGPDATGLGQIFWYTLEGRDPDGNPAGGWDLHELRSVQDWHVRYGLQAAEGVSEVASVGGFVQEYQIDVNPDAMRAYRVTLDEVFSAVRMSNADVGARTVEINNVEYVIRGLGFVKSLEDLRETVVASRDNVPVRIRDVAVVTLGPALRRGVLDKEGAEAVGGVVVARYGANPLEVILNVKAEIAAIAPGLPIKAIIDDRAVSRADVEGFARGEGFEAYVDGAINQDGWLAWLRAVPQAEWPDWVTTSQITVVPFYDRTGLIYETLGTLEEAITLQILVTIIVVLAMVMHLRSSFLISGILPLAVLFCFIIMKVAGVDANIVALSGIAIAIGTMVDMGVILCENMLRHLDEADPRENRLDVVFRATSEVGGAVLTAVSTTVISFLPVFTMTGAEGKLFKPLAFTKTFALIASVVLALTIIPTLGLYVLAARVHAGSMRFRVLSALVAVGLALAAGGLWHGAEMLTWSGVLVALFAGYYLFEPRLAGSVRKLAPRAANILMLLLVGVILTRLWMPIGPEKGDFANLAFVALLIGGLLGLFSVFQFVYTPLLRFFLNHKLLYLTGPVALVLFGLCAWLGVGTVFGWLPEPVKQTAAWRTAYHAFPGFGRDFMPALDEGSFLFMPTTMPHASIGKSLEMLQHQDRAFTAIPEVDSAVGKIGRVESALDPAPVSMVETVINYKNEYILDGQGRRVRFKFDDEAGEFVRDEAGQLVPDPGGRPYRQWRDHVQSPDDIWEEIVEVSKLPGSTSAPKLQPIKARLVMLQSGMRAPMGVKVKGPDLETIERVGLEIEAMLKEVPGVEPAAVLADRIVGVPYLEIAIDRNAIGRYGLQIRDVQDVIEVALGGMQLTTTVEGRERYPVRVRYQRELRDTIETIGKILVASRDGAQIPLEQVADIRYVRGPQMIRSEDTFLNGYVLFDKKDGYAAVDVVENCQRYLEEKRESGAWSIPAGVSYEFAGDYQNQIRAQKTFSVVIPLALFIIFIILYLQFRAVLTTAFVFSGIVVAWAGGFAFMWLYGQDWFLDMTFAGADMREVFQIDPVVFTVAVWVGFLALFGVASDDGVVMATYLDQSFANRRTQSIAEIREAVVVAGTRRIRPCLMTTATTLLALLPVLTSTGRGADVMVPMAIPSFGGMVLELMTLFLVPVLYCMVKEAKFKAGLRDPLLDDPDEPAEA